MTWYKKATLSSSQPSTRQWWSREVNGDSEVYEISTTLGKEMDLLALKKNIVDNIAEKLDYARQSRQQMYQSEDVESVALCPVCEQSSQSAQVEVTVYGARYASCQHCSHVYVLERPEPSAIERFYTHNSQYASTYTDKATAELRLQSIAVPWCKWMLQTYQNAYGCAPKKILDVGAGAGHFVAACRRLGLEAQGIELSQDSRQFAAKVWDIKLDGGDFVDLAESYRGVDVVTFWGVLEHVPNPNALVQSAYELLLRSQAGLIVSKVPRWDCLSTAIQRLNTDTVLRHLDPAGHIMCFTDSSLAELLARQHFAPCAAWYYGMDVYETLMQLGHNLGRYEVLMETAQLQTALQQSIDEHTFSDGLTLAALPQK